VPRNLSRVLRLPTLERQRSLAIRPPDSKLLQVKWHRKWRGDLPGAPGLGDVAGVLDLRPPQVVADHPYLTAIEQGLFGVGVLQAAGEVLGAPGRPQDDDLLARVVGQEIPIGNPAVLEDSACRDGRAGVACSDERAPTVSQPLGGGTSGRRSPRASGAGEVVHAVRIGAKPSLELAQRPLKVRASAGIRHCVSMRLPLLGS
jgi:hypothetical protein